MPRMAGGCLPTPNNYLLILLLRYLQTYHYGSQLWQWLFKILFLNTASFSRNSAASTAQQVLCFSISVLSDHNKRSPWYYQLWSDIMKSCLQPKIIEEMGHLTGSVDDTILSLVGFTAYQHCIHLTIIQHKRPNLNCNLDREYSSYKTHAGIRMNVNCCSLFFAFLCCLVLLP